MPNSTKFTKHRKIPEMFFMKIALNFSAEKKQDPISQISDLTTQF